MDTFLITIIFIILSTLTVGYIKRNIKDKCLKDFENDYVHIVLDSNKTISGRLIVENTGLEFVYSDDLQINEADEYNPGDPMVQVSHIVYKSELAKMNLLVRYHKYLNDKDKISRRRDLSRTYHPGFFQRLKRKLYNLLKNLRDALMEISNTLTGQVVKSSNAAAIISAQQKHTDKVQKELINTIDPSYDPLLEKYIGNLVICELNVNNNLQVIKGVLKEYSAEYIEILNTTYCPDSSDDNISADVIFSRKCGVVRGLGERIVKGSLFEEYNIAKYKVLVKKSLSEILKKDENTN